MSKIDIQRCFEILELDPGASPDDAKQAYKDLVNIWHPDRFSNNRRLKQKAEAKLKQVNMAYEMLKSFLSSKQVVGPQQKRSPPAKAEPEYDKTQAKAEAKDRTEAAVEAGTRMILGVCSYLYKTLRRVVVTQLPPETEVKPEVDPGGLNQRQGRIRGNGRAKGGAKAMRKGKRMGKSGGRGRGGY